MTTIGQRLRVLRLGKGFSVNELAKRSKVSKSYISNIERGVQKNPSLIIMSKLSKTLEVPLEDLVSFKMEEESDVK
ncbi:helix-turn-helix domain-containing protein [Halobacillus yeomjeoni]|uniref:Helix-turn-helix transcriptional regulator n=1 Tax=Halobacillus yeomjeoni TaxID=311194 RepID=A0A931HWK5_9BACI|nr:helix-turn-helix transcriptional regulator [Halobacillus yeomjeoni]MBH0230695.1 helix-turn-helix transcriptional regulator [Halobacillus yeomjeoni]MCA0985222.1 helix-turn-helix domain-containing protein [Halobacillus yeomjeoni]